MRLPRILFSLHRTAREPQRMHEVNTPQVAWLSPGLKLNPVATVAARRTNVQMAALTPRNSSDSVVGVEPKNQPPVLKEEIRKAMVQKVPGFNEGSMVEYR
jgi:hypothetical protein